MLSIPDKAKLKQQLEEINKKVKLWLKSNLASRTATAETNAEKFASEAIARNQVRVHSTCL